MGKSYHATPTPADGPVRKPRARKRPKGAPTHVRSWPLRPDVGQCREIGIRFFTGVRVFNAVLGEFIARSRAVKSDPAWQVARDLPRRTTAECKYRGAAFRAVEAAHGFTVDAAQSYASSLRKSWVREHLPSQETQNLGARAFDAVRLWHMGKKGKPRFKSTKRGLHSLACKDGNGALRPKVDSSGALVGLQWGAGLVIPIAPPAPTGRRGKEQHAELAEIEALIAAGKVLSARIVRNTINGTNTYRMQLVCDGPPMRRHVVGDGRVAFDLGPSEIAVVVRRADGSWSGWVEPLGDQMRLDTARLRRVQRTLDRQHRAGCADCFDSNGVHRAGGCGWQQRTSAAKRTAARVAELHRRLAEHRKTLHGALANRLFGHGADVACEKLDYRAWQKNFPRSVRDRAPGLLVEIVRRKAESAGGDHLYQFNPTTTALSQTCLCGNRKKKPLSQRQHRCDCGIEEHRDIYSAYLALHVHQAGDGSDRLDLHAAQQGWVHRQDVDGSPRTSPSTTRKRRGRRHPPSRRSVARIKARRAARRQSRSARTSITNRPTAILT
ncbi:putative transposase [Mycobacterium frederiksbergense]|uniref:Transposase n=1 Tax=Mycolicibacterium frederiksbergense TaxID=117567 RepID=A0ABT6KYB5_9MYCO|nr:transposase [Mycolicibacterium frederiksbergense]MDH6195699.1 putative transposase [Mycolicibacterium frederiksbergense]